MQIIGCGNLDRGDDGAGVLVLERLRNSCEPAQCTRMITCRGETAELLNSWIEDDEVIVVDAVVTGAPAGTVHCWLDEVPDTVKRAPSSTHGFGIDEAIRLARILGRLPKALYIYGIEGKAFETGTSPSPEVHGGIEEAVRQICTQLTILRN